jgi:hypothetical protein
VNVALGLLVVASALVYLPRFPVVTAQVPSVPNFFTTSEDLQIPENSVVLPFPLTASPNAVSLLWQIRSGFRWKMIGGEAIIPTPRGHVTGQPDATRPVPVTSFLAHYSGSTVKSPPLDATLVNEGREFMHLNDVGTVLVDTAASNAYLAVEFFTAVMGPPKTEGLMDVWLHAQALARNNKNTTLPSAST